jgi:hypothetical protein
LDLNGPDPRLNGSFRQMAVAHQTLPAILGGQVRMGGKKVRHLGFDRSSQELAHSLAQHVGQQIFEFPWLAQGNNGIVLQGVSLLREMWSASSPPRYAASSQTDVTNFAAYLKLRAADRIRSAEPELVHEPRRRSAKMRGLSNASLLLPRPSILLTEPFETASPDRLRG